MLSISSSMILLASSSTTTSSKFLQCFINKTNSTKNIYTPNTSSFNEVLLSSVQNTRFITSNTTTKPTFIITAATFSDVQDSITCSRLSGLRVRVRSGGHDYEAMSYVSSGDPFITIDLANLRAITVDKAQGTAWVQAGATVELYYTIAKNHSTVAFPAGICPTLGVGGHFTGGGIGTLMRMYGTSADNIVDALIVNSKGELMNRKTMGEDLFWAIRGGGGASFGVVLSFNIKLVSVPSTVTVFNVIKNLGENATELVERWQTIAPKFDEKLFIRVVAQAANGGTTIQAVFNSFYLGRIDELLSVMKESFPELGLKREECTEVSWLESVLFFNSELGKSVDVLLDRESQLINSSFKAKSDFVKKSISKEGLEKIWEFLMEAKDQPLTLIWDPLGGKMDEILESDIAFPHRKGNLYNIQYYMRWTESGSAVTEKHLEWMRKMYEFMAPYVSSEPRTAYYNYKDIDLGVGHGSYLEDEVWGVKYFKDNFKRLAFVKGKVDPDDFFRNEQSIPPLI